MVAIDANMLDAALAMLRSLSNLLGVRWTASTVRETAGPSVVLTQRGRGPREVLAALALDRVERRHGCGVLPEVLSVAP